MDKFTSTLKRKFNTKLLKNANKSWAIGLTIIAIAFLFWMVYSERDALLHYTWNFRLDFVFLCILFHLFTIFIQAYTWHLMMSYFNNSRNLGLDMGVFIISFVSRRIPTPILSIGSRFVLYPSDLVRTSSIVIVTGMELGLVGLAGLFSYLPFIGYQSFTNNVFWYFFFGIGQALIIFFFFKPGSIVKLTNFFLRILKRETIDVNISRKVMLVWFILFVLTWYFDGISLYFWVNSIIQIPLNIFDMLNLSILSSMVSYAAQFLPTAFALKEITLSSLLSRWIPVSIGVVVAVSYRVAMFLLEIFLSLISHRIFLMRYSVTKNLPSQD